MSAVAFLLVFLLDETLFDRKGQQTPRGSYLARLTGAQQVQLWHRRSFLQCVMRPIVAITKIPVLIVLIFYFLSFAWVIGVNTTIGIYLTNDYGFSTRGIGLRSPFHLVYTITRLTHPRILLLLRHRRRHHRLVHRALPPRLCWSILHEPPRWASALWRVLSSSTQPPSSAASALSSSASPSTATGTTW